MNGSLASTIALNNGVEMPRFGLGVFRSAEGPEVENAVVTALKAGYRLIDTATSGLARIRTILIFDQR